MHPAIVICAYNRPKSLDRLLRSLSEAKFDKQNIPLVISMDGPVDAEVEELAEEYNWTYGEKTILRSKAHLGLKKHVLSCGKLTNLYGAIILLEDDLFVAPYFYNYACSALSFYEQETRVGGLSLYSYEVAESCFLPFVPLGDHSDVYFMQVASSWGQAWTHAQWVLFEAWLEKYPNGKSEVLPDYVQQWGEQSWKKIFMAYLIDLQKYFVFPRVSYTTNFEDPGTNVTTRGLYQVKLNYSKTLPCFTTFDNSTTIYDAWFEMEPMSLNLRTDILREYDYEIDLYCTKTLSKSYVLTTRSGENEIMRFSSGMKPLIANVICNISGVGINFYKSETVDQKNLSSYGLMSNTLMRKVIENLQNWISLSIVIPVRSFEPEKLGASVEFHTNDVRIEFIFVCSEKRLDVMNSWVTQYVPNGRVVHADEDQLLESGFAHSTNEIVTWLRPGSRLHRDAFNRLAKIFCGFANVNWVSGIEVRTSGKRANTAPFRWNARMVCKYPKRSAWVDTELMFVRRFLMEEVVKKDQNSSLFAKLIGIEPLYVAAFVFGKKGEELTRQTHRLTTKVEPSLIRTLISFLGHRAFLRNWSPWRILFVEVEQLPFVLQYDEANDNFYFSRY